MYVKIPLKLLYEGKVKLLLPDDKLLGEEEVRRIVFYNPIMTFSRDFSICVLKAYVRLKGKKGLRIAEPLAASGVRGIRYAKEVEEVSKAILSDVNPIAVRIARINAVLNQVHEKVVVKLSNANTLLSRYDAKGDRFDFVDIDPFGSPSPYVDSTIRSTLIGGVVALTATDMPPLCGVYPHVALRRYGGLSLRTEYCHELAVRLVLGLLAREAGKYELSIKPLIAHSTKHYIRVFAELSFSKNVTGNIGYVYHCRKCLNRLIVKLEDMSSTKAECEKCHTKLNVAGPLWIGAIFNKAFCEEAFRVAESSTLSSKKELNKILRLIVSEADGPPTFYTIDAISHKYKIKQPKMWHLIETLRSHGFYASPTHFNSKGFRFNGDITELIKILT